MSLSLIWPNVRVACRSLAKQPVFSLTVTGILAIGIAGTTTVFGLFNGVFLRPLPVPDQNRVMNLKEIDPKTGKENFSYPRFHAWREYNKTFECMAVCTSWAGNLSTENTAIRVSISLATHDVFDVLGIQPIIGRRFTAEEDRPGAPHVVLLSYSLWERLFAKDLTVVGRTITVDNDPSYTIIGVLPREAAFPAERDIWCPLCPDPERGHGGLGPTSLGRLKKGVTTEQAQSDLSHIQAGWREQHPDQEAPGRPVVVPLRKWYLDMIAQLRAGVLLLLGVVGLVLLIACCNVTSTMLTRGSHRSREIAVRVALGATHRHVVLQVLAESFVLSVAGGLLGLVLGYYVMSVVLVFIGDAAPPWMTFGLDGRYAVFTAAIIGLTTMLSGFVPAVQAVFTRNIHNVLSTLGTRVTASHARRRTLSAIVVIQIALALTLLVGAGLVLQTFRSVKQVEPGFRIAGVLTYHVPLPIGPYLDENKRHAFWEQHIEQVRGLPGVQHAALVNNLPLGMPSVSRFEVESPSSNKDDGHDQILVCRVTPDYFEVAGVRLLSGRVFTEKDNRKGGEPTAVVTDSFAKLYWGDQNPVGKRIRPQGAETWMSIIGVVADVRQIALDQPVWPGVYLPRMTDASFAMYGVVQTVGDPLSLVPAIRGVVRSADSGVPVDSVQTMSDRVEESMRGRHLSLWLYGIPAVAATIMALAGIYGVTSYAVSQRTQEIGVRMALGAKASDIVKMMFHQGLWLILPGLGIGMVGAFVLSRLLRSIPNMLYDANPTDPLTFVGIPVGLAVVTLVACYLPARRASRIDPMLSLRWE